MNRSFVSAGVLLLLALSAGALDLGVCAHVTWDEFAALDRTCDMCAAAGFKSIRCDFEWSAVQKQSGGSFDFTRFEAVVEAAERRGMSVLPILAGPPSWARPVVEHLDGWSNYVSAVVSRFGNRLPTVEIWNEENLETFWPNVCAADYVRVLNAAAVAAQRGDLPVLPTVDEAVVWANELIAKIDAARVAPSIP